MYICRFDWFLYSAMCSPLSTRYSDIEITSIIIITIIISSIILFGSSQNVWAKGNAVLRVSCQDHFQLSHNNLHYRDREIAVLRVTCKDYFQLSHNNLHYWDRRWLVILHLYVWRYVQKWNGETIAHATNIWWTSPTVYAVNLKVGCGPGNGRWSLI